MASPLSGSLAATIHSAFKDLFLDATLTRDGANTTGQAYSPNLEEPTVYSCKAIEKSSSGARGTDSVGTSSTTILILRNSLSVSPEPMDRIAIPSKGIDGFIPSEEGAVKSDPAAATWKCRVVT
jgi:hypothetical protein